MMELTDFSVIELPKNPPATIPEYIYNLTPLSSIVPVERTVFTYTGEDAQKLPMYIHRASLSFTSLFIIVNKILPHLLADVIGYITKYTALHSFVPKGKEKSTVLREVYLKDLRC
jgi:hypothetical protein